MTVGHTPGPWRSGGCVVWQANGDMVCDLAPTVLRRGPGEVEANADLITAAPEMLAACEAAERYLACLARHHAAGTVSVYASGSGVAVGEDLDTLMDAWFAANEAALKKARGEP
jgi:hypothetical protein